MNISQKIERLRKEKGWSVARLARETEIPTVSLRVMLKRDHGNNWNTLPLKKVAEVLGVTVSYLTSENEGQDIKPQLTRPQYNELLSKIDQTIKSYFDIVDDAK